MPRSNECSSALRPTTTRTIGGWQVTLSEFFDQRNWHAPPVMYAYDIGDDWQHPLVHEGFGLADDDLSYPRCCR